MAQLTTPFRIYTSKIVNQLGKRDKAFFPIEYNSFGNFSSYGGTEVEINGVVVIEETATITCWYDANITNTSRLERLTDGAMFEVMNVENVEMRNQVMIIKAKRVSGV